MHFPSSLQPGNIKQICPIKRRFAEFGPDSGHVSCPAHSADCNAFIPDAVHLGRLTRRSDIERGAYRKPELQRTVWLLSGSQRLVTAHGAGVAAASAHACGGSRGREISSVGIM